MANPFCHVELASTDAAKAKTFYSSFFDWKLNDMDMGGGMTYTTFKPADSNDSPGGGMMQHPVPGAPSSWLPYVLVDDINAANAKAKSLGAKIMKDTQEVPEMGWFSIIIDPTGAALGLWQTMQK
jgi:predicted enzyme related to lactoylglutathione lyase